MEVLIGHFDDRFQLFRRDFALVDKNREDRKCQIEEVQLLRGIVFPISYAPPVESLFRKARYRLRTHDTPIVRVGVKKCLRKRVFLVATASTDILHLMVIEL